MNPQKNDMGKIEGLYQQNIDKADNLALMFNKVNYCNSECKQLIEFYNCILANIRDESFGLGSILCSTDLAEIDIEIYDLPAELKQKLAEWLQRVLEYRALQASELLNSKK